MSESREMTIKRISDGLGMPVYQIEEMLQKGCNMEDVFKRACDMAEEFKCATESVGIPPRRKNSNYTKPRNRKIKPKNKRR